MGSPEGKMSQDWSSDEKTVFFSQLGEEIGPEELKEWSPPLKIVRSPHDHPRMSIPVFTDFESHLFQELMTLQKELRELEKRIERIVKELKKK